MGDVPPLEVDATVPKSDGGGAMDRGGHRRHRTDDFPPPWFGGENLTETQQRINVEHTSWLKRRCDQGKGCFFSDRSSDAPSMFDDLSDSDMPDLGSGDEGEFEEIDLTGTFVASPRDVH